jgi:type IV secretion system protein VirB11
MRDLAPIKDALDNKNFTNIYVYGDGEVEVDDFQSGARSTGVFLDEARRMRIINALASMQGISIDVNKLPVLESIIPGYKIRTTAILPPWTEFPEITFRRPAERIFPLEDYLAQGRMSQAHYNIIVGAIGERKNILVGGGTGSGKTTFVNACLEKMRELMPNERYLLVEDTPELQTRIRRATQLYIRKDQAMDALHVALRWTPKHIIFGELRSGEVAVELVEAWNTGHPGNITTLHADSARSMITRLQGMMREKISGALPDLSDIIHLCVHLGARQGFGPFVNEVVTAEELFSPQDNKTVAGSFDRAFRPRPSPRPNPRPAPRRGAARWKRSGTPPDLSR